MSGLTHQPIQRDDLKGLFVVLEGLDGSGKTTQAIRLHNRLKRRGVPTSLFREPGSTDLGEKVRRILKSGTVDHPITELLLFNAARSSLVSQKISPALANGQVVICDRFASSTIAYQGYGSGIKISLLRLKKHRTSQDHYEQNDFSFHRRVREGYLTLAKENTKTWKILDGTQGPRTLAIAVWEEMAALIRRIN